MSENKQKVLKQGDMIEYISIKHLYDLNDEGFIDLVELNVTTFGEVIRVRGDKVLCLMYSKLDKRFFNFDHIMIHETKIHWLNINKVKKVLINVPRFKLVNKTKLKDSNCDIYEIFIPIDENKYKKVVTFFS